MAAYRQSADVAIESPVKIGAVKERRCTTVCRPAFSQSQGGRTVYAFPLVAKPGTVRRGFGLWLAGNALRAEDGSLRYEITLPYDRKDPHSDMFMNRWLHSMNIA